MIELCALLGVGPPKHETDYQFERPITFVHGDGSTSAGPIDCYKRGHFVWESNKLPKLIKPAGGAEPAAAAAGVRAPGRAISAQAFHAALLRARQHAEYLCPRHACGRAPPALSRG